ncbi:MAG: hypothetical protein M5U07_23810 [Xanthobacteraceae bacterium]|nr:hypothetical protein [Xanthobacteraceae bacterium]
MKARSEDGRFAAVYNDADRGVDDAGSDGLPALDARGIAAACVSAEREHGDGLSTFRDGFISAINARAAQCGGEIGISTADMRDRLERAHGEALDSRDGVIPPAKLDRVRISFMPPLFVSAQRVTDAKNVHIVSIHSDGRILSPMNVLLGRFTETDRLITGRNETLLRIDREGKVWSLRNMLLGRVDRDGRVYDARNRLLGKVFPDGRLVDSSNMLLCTGKGIRPAWLAVWHWWVKNEL